MFKKYFLFVSIITLVVLSSCETDFSLNGEYQRTPIVFGLLDQEDSIHYIKITRTFLGDGDNNEFAQIADSSYFNSVDGYITEFDDDIETGRVWQLIDTMITGKEDGVFYGPEQKMYVFYANDLDESMQYRLDADLDEGTYQIDASTELIKGFRYSQNLLNGNYKLAFGQATSSTTENYGSFLSTYTQGKYAALYNITLHLKYRETYANGSSQEFSIPWSLGDKEQDNPETPTSASFNFPGEQFYVILNENITADENIERVFIGADLTVAIAHTEFAKYMEISQPSSSITQTTPEYTNINCENGALGIFASRNIVTIRNIQLNTGSTVELCVGQYTKILNFCSSLPEHIGETYYCN
jgi:hypothetical protein